MRRAYQTVHRHAQGGSTLVATLLGLLLTACAVTHSFTLSKVKEEVLINSPRGTVFLQNADDGWFKTAHPRSVSPALMAAVLRGIHVMAVPAGAAEPGPMFSDEDAEFLGPLICIALSKAAKRQVVGFRVVHGTDIGTEATGGILYFQGRLLHLTFTHYRAQPEQSDLNPTGLDRRQLSFLPEAIQRSSRHEQPDVINTPPLASLVIDYEELCATFRLQRALNQRYPVCIEHPTVARQHNTEGSMLGEAAASGNTLVTPAKEVFQTHESVQENTTELDQLKEQVHSLQRRLSELEEQKQETKKPQP